MPSSSTTGRDLPGTQLPDNEVAMALALADKLETLAGMFGIGQQPTGDKDPFALRRACAGRDPHTRRSADTSRYR